MKEILHVFKIFLKHVSAIKYLLYDIYFCYETHIFLKKLEVIFCLELTST